MSLASHLVAGLNFSTLPQQLVFGIGLGAIYALIALGYTMVYGVLRLINFAHGEVFMLGAYVALFVSWALGFSPQAVLGHDVASNAVNLFIMLFASMIVCAVIGMLIEFFAYRPMRNQPRIAALITAIGVSLLLQYGGALFLPNSPPPSISEQVNHYRGALTITIVPPTKSLQTQLDEATKTFDEAETKYKEQLKNEKDEFNLTPEGSALRKTKQEAERNLRGIQDKIDDSSVTVRIPTGQLIMLITTIVLMLLLRQLVMKTATGRGMRAVSHDFDSAALMGVNVNRIISITFLIGSALAGAGAMMNATFLGTPLTTFYGVQPGVKAFVAAVLGGIGNIPGAVLGGFVMGLAETMVVWAGYSSYKDAVAFVILIAVLMFKPGGLLGSSKVEKV